VRSKKSAYFITKQTFAYQKHPEIFLGVINSKII